MKQSVWVMFAFLFLVGCAPYGNNSDYSLFGHSNTASPQTNLLGVCNQLDFNNVAWPHTLTEMDRTAFSLAMDISGSLERSDGASWDTITNNFDGQGLSLGLLNQTLGTGSLQPLLWQLHTTNDNVMRQVFSAAHYASLIKMLEQWKASAKALDTTDEQVLSPLDDLFYSMDAAGTAPSPSVKWALDNLYSDKAGLIFYATWKREFQTMASTIAYRQIQIQSAMTYHQKALSYFTKFRLTQLRSYLVMYDFVVQNGGFYPEDQTDYAKWLAKNPKSNETQRLQQLLELRLRPITKYKEDVRQRKQSIIDGQGVVHGARRNYPQEYCFNPLTAYPN